MPSNPFSRQRGPLDEARKRLEAARSDAADAARRVRDAADDVVNALDKGTESRRFPVIGAAAAAALGVGLYVAKRVSGSSEPELPDSPPPPSNSAVTQPAAATGAGASA